MLRLNYTNSDIDELTARMDDEFENIESTIKNDLDVIHEYEKKIESSKLD